MVPVCWSPTNFWKFISAVSNSLSGICVLLGWTFGFMYP